MTVGKQRIEELAAALDSSKDEWSCWVDTNVLLELYSNHDIQNAYDESATGATKGATVAQRGERYAGACWMAMALCKDATSTMSFGDESLALLQRKNGLSDSQGSLRVTFVIHVLSENGFFDGWESQHYEPTLVEPTLVGNAYDLLIGAICRRQNKPIISRDKKQEDWAGLTCFTPEEWAEKSGLTKDAAAKMCADRLGTAGSKYLAKHRAEGTYTDSREQNVVQLLNEFNARWRYMVE